MVTNKILLASQAYYFDSTPCVIIVPIMSRDEGPINALDWSGEAYEAIMLIVSYGNDDDTDFSPLNHVAEKTGFTYGKNYNVASADEVGLAMTLFRDYTRAIYFAQKRLMPKLMPEKLKKRMRKELNFPMEHEPELFYPKLAPNHQDMSVRKISFASNDSKEGHPAPDPILLLSKFISVLQNRHGFRMMAKAEPRADILPSDQSIQAEEDFLRWREEARTYRDPLGMDILVG